MCITRPLVCMVHGALCAGYVGLCVLQVRVAQSVECCNTLEYCTACISRGVFLPNRSQRKRHIGNDIVVLVFLQVCILHGDEGHRM